MGLVESLYASFLSTLPIFLRVSSFIFAVPLFGRGIPSLVKVGLSGFVTFLLAGVLPEVPIPQDMAGFVFLCAEEVAVGLAMGLTVALVFGAVYLAGQLIDIPIGFGMANVLDPQAGIEAPVMSQFHFVLAMLVFFVVDGHRALLWTLAQSIWLVPPGAAAGVGEPAAVFLRSFGMMFELGVKISLPIVGALFLADVALGIVARAVPQINVFFVGFPVKIGLGVALLVSALPFYVGSMAYLFDDGGEMVRSLVELLSALAVRE